jgi:hypothetical protein
MEKIEELVSGVMMPLFFLIVGLRVKVAQIAYNTSWANVCLIIALAFVPKKNKALPIETTFQLPSPLPIWPPGMNYDHSYVLVNFYYYYNNVFLSNRVYRLSSSYFVCSLKF